VAAAAAAWRCRRGCRRCAMCPLGCFACMRLKTPLSLAALHVMVSMGKSVMQAMVGVLVERCWL